MLGCSQAKIEEMYGVPHTTFHEIYHDNQVLHDAQETIQNILNEDAAAENESETSNEEQVESETSITTRILHAPVSKHQAIIRA